MHMSVTSSPRLSPSTLSQLPDSRKARDTRALDDSQVTASSGLGPYVSNPSLGSKDNDPIYQGYSLTIPADQTEPPGPMPGAGDFSWVNPPSTSSLWGTQGTPGIDDIKQGELGDCYFDAAVGSVLTSSSLGPSAIQKMIQPAGPGSPAGTYDVTFYAKNATTGDATPVVIPVNASELEDQAGDLIGNQANANGALWPQILEKAYGIYANEYPDNTMGSTPGATPSSYDYSLIDDHGATEGTGDARIVSAMYAMTGEATTNTQVADASDSQLQGLLQNAGTSPVIANSKPVDHSTHDPGGVSAPHVYTVVGYDAANQTVTLRDPHGVNESDQTAPDGNGQFTIPYATFKEDFDAVTSL